MPQFVLVANGVTSAQFEKALEVKIRSGSAVSFIPQAMLQQIPTSQGVSSLGMATGQIRPIQSKPPEEVLNGVRFEWGENASEFGSEIVKMLAQKHEPAA
jgi:hypothetical protein